MVPLLALVTLSFLIFTLLLFRCLRNRNHSALSLPTHPPEPPTISIPVWSLLRHWSQVLEYSALANIHDATKGQGHPGIFTASILFGLFKAYVVTSPSITIQVASKSHSRDFAFVPLFFMLNMGGIPAEKSKKLIGDDAGQGFKDDFHAAHVGNLALGVKHYNILDGFHNAWSPFLDGLKRQVESESTNQGKEVDMWLWLKQAAAISICEAIWGVQCPFSVEPDLWKDMWTFVENYHPAKCLSSHMVPWKGIKERDHVVDAFVRYADKKGSDVASPLAKAREVCIQSKGMDKQGLAECAVSMAAGQITAAAAAYSALAQVLAIPGLADRLREEIRNANLKANDNDSKSKSNIMRAADECPLLLSCLHESLRLNSLGATIRSITHSHTLTVKNKAGDGPTYFLKKDRIVWASGFAVHGSPTIHKDPRRFIPERFLGLRFPETQKPELFRSFGGGGNICLGRNVMRDATTAVLASLLMEFDFLPTDSGEVLSIPHISTFTFEQAVTHPKGNTVIKMRLRGGDAV